MGRQFIDTVSERSHFPTYFPHKPQTVMGSGYSIDLYTLADKLDKCDNDSVKQQVLGLIPSETTHQITPDGIQTKRNGLGMLVPMNNAGSTPVKIFIDKLGKNPGIELTFCKEQRVILDQLG